MRGLASTGSAARSGRHAPGESPAHPVDQASPEAAPVHPERNRRSPGGAPQWRTASRWRTASAAASCPEVTGGHAPPATPRPVPRSGSPWQWPHRCRVGPVVVNHAAWRDHVVLHQVPESSESGQLPQDPSPGGEHQEQDQGSWYRCGPGRGSAAGLGDDS